MHPCLRLDEIIRLLARELVESQAKTTAVALACCCKTFEEPVLDVLWETQARLTPLLKCLPQDTWEGSTKFVSLLIAFTLHVVNHKIRKSFKRTPTKAEWADFRKYALRMRRLEMGVSTDDPTILDIFLVQHSHATKDPWLPRLKTFICGYSTEEFIPFIPFFLSPQTTKISIGFRGGIPPAGAVAPMITRLPTLCPNIESITLDPLPTDPVTTEAVSEMLLACRGDRLQVFTVGSPLTEEARKVVYQLPRLLEIGTKIEDSTLLPPVALPNLTTIYLEFDGCLDWLRGFRGANLEKLETVGFHSTSGRTGDFLGAFESIALAASAQNTLSYFRFYTPHSWNPNYRSLLPFTQLEELSIESSCEMGCSSNVEDDVLVEMARAMPKLEPLELGGPPCQTSTGVTIKGLTALARNCRHLSRLRIHFRTDSIFETPSHPDDETAARRHDCALTDLEVGRTPLHSRNAAMVAKGLLQIFPCLWNIQHAGGWWPEVELNVHFFQQNGEAKR